MTTTPALIDPKYTGNTWSSFQYKLKSETSTYATYDRWDGTNYFNNEIKVGIDSTHADFNIWSDADSATHPYNVLRDGLPDASGTGGTIELVTSGGNIYFAFDKPVLGTSSSGTASSNSVITITQSGNLLVVFYGGGNASVSNLSIVDSNDLVPSNPGVSVWHTHTNGTDTTFTWPITEIGTYRLMNLSNFQATITVTSFPKRKVHCNFW